MQTCKTPRRKSNFNEINFFLKYLIKFLPLHVFLLTKYNANEEKFNSYLFYHN